MTVVHAGDGRTLSGLAAKLAARAAHHRRKAAQDSPFTPLGWALQEHWHHTGAAVALEDACRELAEIVEGKS